MGMEMDMECDLVEIVQSGVPAGDVDLSGVDTQRLLDELGRRGVGMELAGAVGTLYDHLERIGALASEDKTTSYLAFRMRRDAAFVSPGLDESQRKENAAFWQEKIDAL